MYPLAAETACALRFRLHSSRRHNPDCRRDSDYSPSGEKVSQSIQAGKRYGLRPRWKPPGGTLPHLEARRRPVRLGPSRRVRLQLIHAQSRCNTCLRTRCQPLRVCWPHLLMWPSLPPACLRGRFLAGRMPGHAPSGPHPQTRSRPRGIEPLAPPAEIAFYVQ